MVNHTKIIVRSNVVLTHCVLQNAYIKRIIKQKIHLIKYQLSEQLKLNSLFARSLTSDPAQIFYLLWRAKNQILTWRPLMIIKSPHSSGNELDSLSEILIKWREGEIDRKLLTTCCFYASELSRAVELSKKQKNWLINFDDNIREARELEESFVNQMVENGEK